MKKTVWVIIIALLVAGLTAQAQQRRKNDVRDNEAKPSRKESKSVPWTINYQGYLAGSDTLPITGQVDIEFSIYDQLIGGTRIWGEEVHSGVCVTKGFFNVQLGSALQFDPGIFDGNQRYLEIVVNGSTLSPRKLLGSVGYAIKAQKADTALFSINSSLSRPIIPPIDSAEISANAITSAKIADGSIGRVDVASDFKAPYADTADYAHRAQKADTADWCSGVIGDKWASNGNNIYNTNSGNVGIGMTSPTSIGTNVTTLHMQGLNGAGFKGTTPGGIEGGVYVGGDGLGLYAAGNKSITFNDTQMRLTSSGNVGIGTTAPNEKLDVFGGIRASNSSSNYMYMAHGGSSGGLISANGTPSDLHIYTGGSEHLTILSNGNVGIGATSPTLTFHVNKAVTANYLAAIHNSGTGASDNGLVVRTEGGDIFLAQSNGGESQFIVKQTGNVGIGTTSPGHKLTVQGSGDSNTGALAIDITGSGSYKWASAAIAPSLAAGNNIIHMMGQAESTNNAGYIGFNYQGAGSNNNFLTLGLHGVNNVFNITGAGNVGIGTTSPGQKLEVAGTTKTNGFLMPTGAASGYVLTADAGGNASWQAPSTAGPHNHLGETWSGTGNLGLMKKLNANSSGDVNAMVDSALNAGTGSAYGGQFYGGGEGTGYKYGVFSQAYAPAGSANSACGILSFADHYGTGSTYGGYFFGWGGSGTSYGVYSSVEGLGTKYAGYFDGNVVVTGSLSKGGGSFLIDHPLDPQNKTLRHNFVESPENLCLYRGKAKLNSSGEAKVTMPDYFKALTKETEATVTLTSIGRPFNTGYEWNGDCTVFTVYGDPNREVSYIVMADRDDPVMKQLYKPVEEEKGNGNFTKGKLLYPKAYGYSEEMGEDYEKRKQAEEHAKKAKEDKPKHDRMSPPEKR